MHYTQRILTDDLSLSAATYKARESLLTQMQQGHLPMLCPELSRDELSRWQGIAQSWSKRFTNVIVLGTGGSSLGAQTLVALKQGPTWHHPGSPRLHFLDNLDSSTFCKTLESLDLSQTGFLVISKSGTTAETLCQFLLLLQMLEKHVDAANHLCVITQTDCDSPLLQLSRQLNLEILAHPSNIGGRFSAFTVVGLLPAMLAGVDVEKLVLAACRQWDAFSRDLDHSALWGAEMHNHWLEKGHKNTVMLPYADQLSPLALWFRQLWAESLGKQGKGTTPIHALGPVDQHSQLQLYLDGPKDKVYTVLSVDTSDDTARVNSHLAAELGLEYLSGATMAELVQAECKATINSLVESGCPVRVITMKRLDEESLAALMQHFFLETLLVSHLWQVNPFDQPAVETSKRVTKAYLLEGKCA